MEVVSVTHVYRLVLLDYEEEPVGGLDHESNKEYHHNDWIILGEDIRLVADIKLSSAPYKAELDCMYVGLSGDPRGLQETDPIQAAARAGAKPS